MTICWHSDPQGRAKFADMAQQLSNTLEKEAGYLSLHHTLTWKTCGETPKKEAITNTPILQRVEEGVVGESTEMDEADVSDAEKMKLKRSVEAHERDSAV